MADENEEILSQEEISAILHVDPFAEEALEDEEKDEEKEQVEAKDKDGAEGEEDEPSGDDKDEGEDALEDESEGGKKAKPDSSEEEPEKVKEPDPRDLEIASLKQSIEQLQSSLKAVTEAKEPADKKADEKKPQDLHSRYAFNIPSKLMDLLNSEEPQEREQGVGALLQGVGVAVHQQVMKAAEELVDSKLASLGQQSEAKIAQKQVYDDFYEKFPELKPFEAVVGQVGVQMANETGLKKWTPEFRDALGVRVTRLLKDNAANLGMVVQQEKKEEKGKKPPKQLSSSSRPAGRSDKNTEPNSEADILASLDLA